MRAPPNERSPAPQGGGYRASKNVRHSDGLNTSRDTAPRPDFQDRARRQRQVALVHAAGPRVVYEFALELSHGADLDVTLAAFTRIPVNVYLALGADRFPPMPLTVVRAA